ncbi:MAG: PilZ domain-containing protein [Phycisphaerales bacterium]
MNSQSPDLTTERRRHPRIASVRPAKVFVPEALRFAPAQTTDLSEGGALLCVDRSRPLAPGDVIEVLVTPKDPGLSTVSEMTRARVVRVTPVDHFQQAVAVEYDAPATAIAA